MKCILTDSVIEIFSVSSRGQVGIPERMRKELGVEKGTHLVAVRRNDDILLRKEDAATEDFLKGWADEDKEWFRLGMESFKEVWDNPQDEEWSKELLRQAKSS